VQTYTAAKNAEIKEAEERRERCRHECHEAHAEVARAEDDAREIHARIDVVAAREREQAVALARAEADRIVRNAEGELERQRIAARDRLRIEFIEKALAKARDEATRRVDDAANIRLVDATVNDLTRRRG
jgi:F0F1-type ATP synthase membrane subunit b/b'